MKYTAASINRSPQLFALSAIKPVDPMATPVTPLLTARMAFTIAPSLVTRATSLECNNSPSSSGAYTLVLLVFELLLLGVSYA